VDGTRAAEVRRESAQLPQETGSVPPREREAARAALARGLDWLATAAATTPDGSLPRGGAEEPAPVAVTSLAALAWMGGGDGPERGSHGRELAAAIDWIVAHTELDPRSETLGYISEKGDGRSRMHGHGFAALALAQAAALSPKSERGARIERALRAAIGCIEKSQGVEGGWWYDPRKSLEHEGSITICEVQALRAAHNAGFKVDPLTIARALDYLARSQKEDGSFRYALGDERTSLALTAAAIATLNAAGKYEGKVLQEAYGSLFRGSRPGMSGSSDTPRRRSTIVGCRRNAMLATLGAPTTNGSTWRRPCGSIPSATRSSVGPPPRRSSS
jgi:hypothetical protein